MRVGSFAVSLSSSSQNSSISHSIHFRESRYLSITSQSAMSARIGLFWKDRGLLATATAAILFSFETFYDLTVTLREVVTSRKLPGKLPGQIAGLKITGALRNTCKVYGRLTGGLTGPDKLPGLSRNGPLDHKCGPSIKVKLLILLYISLQLHSLFNCSAKNYIFLLHFVCVLTW